MTAPSAPPFATSHGRRPPRLVVKTLAVTFITVFTLLLIVFVVVSVSVSDQVRRSVTANLESSQRMFAALETRRQRELVAQAATLAENPTLKAALDTYQAEARTSNDAVRTQLLATIDGELRKVAASIESDAVVLVDMHRNTLAAAGRMGERFPRGRPVALSNGQEDAFDGIARLGGAAFRTVAVPLQFSDRATVGTLYLATSLDAAYAEELARLAGTRTAIISDGLMLASTLPPGAAREFESAVAATRPDAGTITLNGESYAFRRLVAVGGTGFYALGSIDESSRGAMRQAMRNLGFTAVGAIVLALLGSVTLARLLARPIGQLSTSLARMAASHDVTTRLPLTGSSREVDALTDTFNELMASVAVAEAQTEAAYTGAIRALAAALDARDPYTAGHSDRVSVLSVAIGRSLSLPADDLEVLRLGALLHDIGKIGVPDDVLRKPGALTDAEFDTIKQHPVLGARILRSVPFLARHIPIVELHHERPDGRGYPSGLRGDDIPLAARIVHVADAYDAMTSTRAYRGARPSGDAVRELWRYAGTEFHADIVDALGTGVTPITGLRLGASFAHGLYATSEEITVPSSPGRAMTMAGAEGEWAFGGTKVSGEFLRTGFETAASTSVAYEWFVQGQQTLSPRWFAAARREGTSAAPLISGTVVGSRTHLAVFEATAGFRVTPDLTLRSSYYARRSYGASTWTDQAGVSVVWAHRWW